MSMNDLDPTYASSSNSSMNLLLRHPSQCSLDESSQRTSCPEEDTYKPSYKDKGHFQKMFNMLETHRREKIMCDVVLVATDQRTNSSVEIPAHRIILSSCSPYFLAMFSKFEEKDKDAINIHGVEPVALEMIISYVYTGRINITEDTVQFLLPAANLLQIEDIKYACCEFLKAQLHSTNSLGIRKFAFIHDCIDLLNTTETFIQQNFVDIAEGEEFLSLESDQVIELVQNDKLFVPKEEVVFESVLNWINHDPEKRAQFVPALMENVRFPLLSKDYLISRVDSEPLLKCNSHCKDLIIEALKFHLLEGDQRNRFNSPRTRPRGVPQVFLVMGGQSPKAIRCIESYDFQEDGWRLLADMPNRRCRAGVAVFNGKVYAVGGFNGCMRVKSVDIFDPSTSKWSNGPPLIMRRSTLGVAVLNNKLYAIGGFDGTQGLDSGEVLGLHSKKWTSFASMSTKRSSVGVGVLNGKIYAVGGYDGTTRSCLSTVERYDPELDAWEPVAPMLGRRSGAGVGVVKGVMYVVGGHDGPVVRKSVEMYDESKNSWTLACDMSICRRNAGVVTMNNLLFVIGGDDGTKYLSTVEVYDPVKRSCSLLESPMVMGRSYAGVCVVDKPCSYM